MGTVVDKAGNKVDPRKVPLTREQEVNLLIEMQHHPGWAVYSNLLKLNWEKAEKLLLNPEFARDHEGHTDDFLKGLIRGYQQSNALPEVAAGQWLEAKKVEEAKRAKEEADKAAGIGEPGFREEALPPDYTPETPDEVPSVQGGEG